MSARSDEVLRALIEIAGRTEALPVSAEKLGNAQDIPQRFLHAILANLRRVGVGVSACGQSGGWRMARPPAEVTVADVIRVVDGPLSRAAYDATRSPSYQQPKVGRGLRGPAGRAGPTGGRERSETRSCKYLAV